MYRRINSFVQRDNKLWLSFFELPPAFHFFTLALQLNSADLLYFNCYKTSN